MSDPPERIYLTGFMAAGKSEVGRALAARMGWMFVDTDEIVQERTGRSVSDLFAESEEAFRDAEASAAVEAARMPRCVVALGGGALSREETRRLAADTGLLVYLNADVGSLKRRLEEAGADRPLVAGLDGEGLQERIERLLHERSMYYETAAVVVDSSDGRSIEQIVEDILYAIHN